MLCVSGCIRISRGIPEYLVVSFGRRSRYIRARKQILEEDLYGSMAVEEDISRCVQLSSSGDTDLQLKTFSFPFDSQIPIPVDKTAACSTTKLSFFFIRRARPCRATGTRRLADRRRIFRSTGCNTARRAVFTKLWERTENSKPTLTSSIGGFGVPRILPSSRRLEVVDQDRYELGYRYSWSVLIIAFTFACAGTVFIAANAFARLANKTQRRIHEHTNPV